MPPVGFEPTIPAVKPLHTYALDRTAAGIGTGASLHSRNKTVDIPAGI
jgi:hypothetical protein